MPRQVSNEEALKEGCGGALCRAPVGALFEPLYKAKSLDQSIKALLVAGAQEGTRVAQKPVSATVITN